MDAIGEVVVVGPRLIGRKVGDIVAYVGSTIDSYTEEQILYANKVFHIPPSLGLVIAALIMLKSMTAQFLLRRCFKVGCICIQRILLFGIF